jgi:predicted small lipoprotein YifL
MILIVKPASYLFYLVRITVLLLVSGMLGACGQRGPLYLPGKPDAATPVTPVAVPTNSTTPASR